MDRMQARLKLLACTVSPGWRFMTSHNTVWITDLHADAEREKRIEAALLRSVAESIKSNRLVVPVFGLAVCAMFPQWVGLGHLSGWYIQLLIGMAPQLVLLQRFPHGSLGGEDVRKWSLRIAAANLFLVANWSTLGFWLWAGGNKNSNHIMIELLLAATFAAHAAITGACRTIARPALGLYLAVLVAVPLQGIFTVETFSHSVVMVALAPFYVAFLVLIGRRNRMRARASIILSQERDVLMAELVMAKLES